MHKNKSRRNTSHRTTLKIFADRVPAKQESRKQASPRPLSPQSETAIGPTYLCPAVRFLLVFRRCFERIQEDIFRRTVGGVCHSSAPSSVCLHSKNVLFKSVAGALCRVESVTSRTPSTTQQAGCTTMRSRIRRSSARVASVARQLAAEVAAQLPAHCIRMPAQHNWLYGCLRWLASQLAEACVS